MTEGTSHLPPHHLHCLGCGPENPHGHRLRVHRDGEVVRTRYTFDARHVGAPGIAHGGAVATVVDDLLGFLLYVVAVPAVTRHLEVDYLQPVLLGHPYDITAHVVDRDGRKLWMAARATTSAGELAFIGRALFIAVGVEHFTRAAAAARVDLDTP